MVATNKIKILCEERYRESILCKNTGETCTKIELNWTRTWKSPLQVRSLQADSKVTWKKNTKYSVIRNKLNQFMSNQVEINKIKMNQIISN